MGNEICLIKTFFQLSSFVFSRTNKNIKSSQVKYIYIVLFTIQIVSKLLHNINQDDLTVFVYSWKKKTFGRADQ